MDHEPVNQNAFCPQISGFRTCIWQRKRNNFKNERIINFQIRRKHLNSRWRLPPIHRFNICHQITFKSPKIINKAKTTGKWLNVPRLYRTITTSIWKIFQAINTHWAGCGEAKACVYCWNYSSCVHWRVVLGF